MVTTSTMAGDSLSTRSAQPRRINSDAGHPIHVNTGSTTVGAAAEAR